MEGKCLALVFLFSVVLAFLFGNYNNISEYIIRQQVKPTYDYNNFVIQWKISACMLRTCKKGRAKPEFGIHGLWPGKKDSPDKHVIYCDSEAKFDPKKFSKSLRADLESLWPSLKQKVSDEEFWGHEWKKHGTCFDDGSLPETAVVNYFKRDVSLAKAYNILKYLQEENINPGVRYDVNIITYAIKKHLPVKTDDVQLQCPNTTTLNGTKVYQIFLCFNKNATALENCPRRDMCSGKPMFPSNVSQGTETYIPVLAEI